MSAKATTRRSSRGSGRRCGRRSSRSIDVGYKSDSIWSEHVDLGGRFGADDRFGYRLNATHEEGKTFNDGGIRRDSVSLALDARLTRDLTWNFDALYQKRKSTDQTPSIYTGSYVGTSLPATIRGDNQLLVGSGQHLNTDLKLYSTGLQYQLSPDWTLGTSYSHSTAKRSRNEGIAYLLDPSGNYNDFRSDSSEGHRFDQWQAMAQGIVRTGAVEHQLTLGASWQKQTNDYSSNSVYSRSARATSLRRTSTATSARPISRSTATATSRSARSSPATP